MTMEDSTTIRIRTSKIMVIVRQTTASSALAAEDNRMDTRETQEKCTVQLGGRFAIIVDTEIILVRYASDDRNQQHSKEIKEQQPIQITAIQI